MTYTGLTTRPAECAICGSGMPKGTLVYFDSTKRQGKHLVHFECWETLRKARDKPLPRGSTVQSKEPLDAPF